MQKALLTDVCIYTAHGSVLAVSVLILFKKSFSYCILTQRCCTVACQCYIV